MSHPSTEPTDRLVLAPEGRRKAILELLRSAEREIILSLFRCDDLTVVDELAAAVNRGVRVRVLITQRARGWKEKLKDLTLLLRSFGAEVRPYESPVTKYHAKYVVSDDCQALVMSLNFTRKCFESTCDFLVFTEQPAVVSGLKTLFENDYHSPSSPLPDLTNRLIIGPNHARQRLMDILSEARNSIHIMDHRVTDPQFLALLAEKHRQGVPVQVLGNGTMGGVVWHGRMILVDEKTAIIGSIHLSPPSLDSRREVAIVVEDPNLVSELYDYFQNLAMHEVNLMNLWAAPPASPEDEDDEEEE
jgi:cardiolipin synthase A/B